MKGKEIIELQKKAEEAHLDVVSPLRHALEQAGIRRVYDHYKDRQKK
jgi:hypothetical protein